MRGRLIHVFARTFAPAVGTGVGLALVVFFAIAAARLDWHFRPGEETIIPRHAADFHGRRIEEVIRGQIIVIGGKYRTLRTGCRARFERTTEFTHDVLGNVTRIFVHSGSFDVSKVESTWARHELEIPMSAVPGSILRSRISEAWYDCLHWPFGLSRVPRQYADVELRVL